LRCSTCEKTFHLAECEWLEGVVAWVCTGCLSTAAKAEMQVDAPMYRQTQTAIQHRSKAEREAAEFRRELLSGLPEVRK